MNYFQMLMYWLFRWQYVELTYSDDTKTVFRAKFQYGDWTIEDTPTLNRDGRVMFLPYSRGVTWQPITPRITKFYKGPND